MADLSDENVMVKDTCPGISTERLDSELCLAIQGVVKILNKHMLAAFYSQSSSQFMQSVTGNARSTMSQANQMSDTLDRKNPASSVF